MKRQTRAILVVLTGFGGVFLLVGLTVYPFQYGLNKSLLLVGVLIAFALFEIVLDNSSL